MVPVTAITICVLASCSKSNKSNTPAGSMTAIANGRSFTSHDCVIQASSRSGLNVIGYEGPRGTSRNINFGVASYTTGATGTYSITPYPDLSVTADLDSTYGGHWADSGTITITTASATAVSGTFSFTTKLGDVVTSGVFSAVK